jgi:hypothetical protein
MQRVQTNFTSHSMYTCHLRLPHLLQKLQQKHPIYGMLLRADLCLTQRYSPHHNDKKHILPSIAATPLWRVVVAAVLL